MDSILDSTIRQQLNERREKLEVAIRQTPQPEQLTKLLEEVDLALDKVNRGTFGICETCKDPVETDRLLADPLIRFCLDHLNEVERRALQHDLDLALQIQTALLPPNHFQAKGWTTGYHFEPVGPVSGDYCDIIPLETDGSFLFLIGDVTGKGVAASMLVAQLHAIFRSLKNLPLSVDQLMEHANRIFSTSTITTHFATLICGIAHPNGEVEICNAGHFYPMLVQKHDIRRISSTGFPLGMFCEGKYTSVKTRLATGETLVLFTDGLTDAVNGSGQLYGEERLSILLTDRNQSSPEETVRTCLKDQEQFRGGTAKTDDITLLVLQRD